MILSIIVPVYNEEKTIIQILEKLRETKSGNISYQVIVINDCSIDDTKSLLEANDHLYEILINNPSNIGKGGSVKKALEYAEGQYVIFQDADLEYDPSDLTKFVDLIFKFNPDVILGSRFNYDRYTKSHNFFNKMGNHFLSFLFNIFFNTTFTDIYCCYFCFKRELIDPKILKTSGFEQQAEILAKCVKASNSFYEVPVNYSGRSVLEGKKIKFYHIFFVIKQILKNRII
jgi:glycosyltransferase involved in cell wall biosynthesis